MTTQCFLLGTLTTKPDRFSTGTNSARLDGTAGAWLTEGLATSRGSGLLSTTAGTLNGPTAGLETNGANPSRDEWVSPPIDQDVTISGTITMNLWMVESNMSANVGPQIVIERVDSTGAVTSTILNHEKGTELPTAAAAQNWTATPTSTNMKKGDRIRIRVAGNDGGGTMVGGFTFTLDYAGATAAADGDSYVTFNETFGFQTTDPTGTTLWLTDTDSDIDPGGAGTDTKEAWTTQGTFGVSSVTNTVSGWAAPVQATKTAGGNLIEWYSRQLTAFTLSGVVLVTLYGTESSGAANTSPRIEIAVCASDGSGPVVWAATTTREEWDPADLTTPQFYLAGADLAVTDGQRLRIRSYLDDDSSQSMVTGFTVTLRYNGNASNNKSLLILPQSVTEFVAVATSVYPFKPVPFIPRGRSM